LYSATVFLIATASRPIFAASASSVSADEK
jgi:hypothetical protein